MLVDIYSANEPKGVMEVSHMDGNTTAERFQNEWAGCVDGMKELYPDSYNVCDVEDAMQKAGWNMQDVKVEATVEY